MRLCSRRESKRERKLLLWAKWACPFMPTMRKKYNEDWTKTSTLTKQQTRIDVGAPRIAAIDEIYCRVTNNDEASWNLKENTKLDMPWQDAEWVTCGEAKSQWVATSLTMNDTGKPKGQLRSAKAFDRQELDSQSVQSNSPLGIHKQQAKSLLWAGRTNVYHTNARCHLTLLLKFTQTLDEVRGLHTRTSRRNMSMRYVDQKGTAVAAFPDFGKP